MDCYPIATSHPSNVPEYHRRSSRIILSSPHRRWYRSQAHRILRYLLLKEAWELRPILNTAVLRLVVANASTTVRPHQDKAYMLPSLYARLLVSHACWRVGAHPDIHSSYIGKAGPDRHGKPVLIIPRGFVCCSVCSATEYERCWRDGVAALRISASTSTLLTYYNLMRRPQRCSSPPRFLRKPRAVEGIICVAGGRYPMLHLPHTSLNSLGVYGILLKSREARRG